MDDILYVKDYQVCVSDTGMQIPEFKDFKKYDRSKDNFFQTAMTYIFYVYKVFGDTKNMSCYSNLPLKQRQLYTVRNKTIGYDIEDFEDNTRVRKCIDAYLELSRTQAERLLDAFKGDLEEYIKFVQDIPLTLKGKAPVRVQVPGEDRMESTFVDVDVPNIETRMKALKEAQAYKEMYSKWDKQARRDGDIKATQGRMFENPDQVKKIDLGTGFPVAKE